MAALIVALVLVAVVLIVLIQAVRIVPAGPRRNRRAPRPLQPHARPGLHFVFPFIDRLRGRSSTSASRS